jgi:hypothetical protein
MNKQIAAILIFLFGNLFAPGLAWADQLWNAMQNADSTCPHYATSALRQKMMI